MRHLTIAIAFATALLAAPWAEAGDEEFAPLVKAYYAAMGQGGLASVGQFLHPDALAEFKALLLPLYEKEAEVGARDLTQMTFGQTTTIADIRSMDPRAFYDGLMTTAMGEVGRLGISYEQVEVLGTVDEAEVRHVLVRITGAAGEMTMTELQVLSYMAYGDSWRMQINPKLWAFARGAASSVEDN